MSLLCLVGCGTMGDMYQNMVQTNEKMEANIVLLNDVQDTVRENSVQVVRSTNQIIHLGEVNHTNAEAVKTAMAAVHPSGIHKLAVLGLLLLFVVPCLVLGFSYFKLKRKS
ncbi:MAG: hypothetical protein JSS30_00105 [Verrucomicrobia bacterium]|nr:hypothetical protein [Verrucomicrobiota bacterium]